MGAAVPKLLRERKGPINDRASECIGSETGASSREPRPALALQSWIEERKGLRGLLFKQRADYAEKDGTHAGISATIRTKGKRGLCSLSDRNPNC
jgi:hypothetical protein